MHAGTTDAPFDHVYPFHTIIAAPVVEAAPIVDDADLVAVAVAVDTGLTSAPIVIDNDLGDVAAHAGPSYDFLNVSAAADGHNSLLNDTPPPKAVSPSSLLLALFDLMEANLSVTTNCAELPPEAAVSISPKHSVPPISPPLPGAVTATQASSRVIQSPSSRFFQRRAPSFLSCRFMSDLNEILSRCT